MLLCWDNHLVKAKTTAGTPVTLTNATAQQGTHVNNLLYEDTTLRLISSAPSADPTLRFEIDQENTTTDNFVSGFVDWRDPWGYDGITMETAPGAGGPWTEVFSYTFPAKVFGQAPRTVLFRHAAVVGNAHFRFTFNGTPTRPALDIANLVVFKAVEVDINPDTGGILGQAAYKSRLRQGIGGSPHLVREARAKSEVWQWRWARMSQTLHGKVAEIHEDFKDRWCAVVPPIDVGVLYPNRRHIVGYPLGFNTAALHGASQTEHVYLASLSVEGGIY